MNILAFIADNKVQHIAEAAFVLEYSPRHVLWLDQENRQQQIMFPTQTEILKLLVSNACVACQALDIDTEILDNWILENFTDQV
ncbi:MAG: hypothetical protein LPK01_04030 [Hymenobacteraceae bacterium]|nr:hypothetical protein [Hymenobacteraceae bacterium]